MQKILNLFLIIVLLSFKTYATDTLSLDYRATKMADKLVKQMKINNLNDKKGLSHLNNYIIQDNEIVNVNHNIGTANNLWDFSQTSGDLLTLKNELLAYNTNATTIANNQKIYLIAAAIYNKYYDIAYFDPVTGTYNQNKPDPLGNVGVNTTWNTLPNIPASQLGVIDADIKTDYQAISKQNNPKLDEIFRAIVYKKAFLSGSMPTDAVTVLMITTTYEWNFKSEDNKPSYKLYDNFNGWTSAANSGSLATPYYLRTGYLASIKNLTPAPTRHKKALELTRNYIAYFDAIKDVKTPIGKHWVGIMMGWYRKSNTTLPNATLIAQFREGAMIWDKLYNIRMDMFSTEAEKEQLCWEMYQWAINQPNYVLGMQNIKILSEEGKASAEVPNETFNTNSSGKIVTAGVGINTNLENFVCAYYYFLKITDNTSVNNVANNCNQSSKPPVKLA